MRVLTVHLTNGLPFYDDLLRVFHYSLRKNTKLPLTILTSTSSQIRYSRYKFKKTSNSEKLNLFNRYVKSAKEDLILMDCDMLVVKDFSEIFDLVDHVGYTYADYHRKVPFNGGVIVVKNSPQAKAEIEELTRVNNHFLRNPSLHSPYRAKYAGMNQSAMGYLFENGHKWTPLPMSVYNLCDNWHTTESKIIHYKSRLMENTKAKDFSSYSHFVKLWWDYYTESISSLAV